jgi:hypothetical protein
MALYKYFCNQCGKTYIGEPNPGMVCNCTPPRLMIGAPYVLTPEPLSAELLTQLNIQAATTRRGELCGAWSINNHSHKSHRGNFSAPQTLVQLINNIVTPLIGAERERVSILVIRDFGYDIDTQRMA